MSIKSMVLVVFVGLLVVGGFWLFDEENGGIDAAPDATEAAMTEIARLEEKKAAGEEITEEELEAALDDIDRMMADAANTEYPPHVLQDQERWDRERGWHFEDGDSLKYYPTANNRANIERMAAEGDTNAMLALARIASEAEREQWIEEAAILGSTRALVDMSGYKGMLVRGEAKQQRESADSEVDQHLAAVEQLEYLFVAELRGDSKGGTAKLGIVMRNYQYLPEDIEQACTQAQYRYGQLEAKRMARGLPAFDNSPPPIFADVPLKIDGLCNYDS